MLTAESLVMVVASSQLKGNESNQANERCLPSGDLLVRRADGTKLNGFAGVTAVSAVNRTAGGLMELAKSEFDEAMLACRSRSNEVRRSATTISEEPR